MTKKQAIKKIFDQIALSDEITNKSFFKYFGEVEGHFIDCRYDDALPIDATYDDYRKSKRKYPSYGYKVMSDYLYNDANVKKKIDDYQQRLNDEYDAHRDKVEKIMDDLSAKLFQQGIKMKNKHFADFGIIDGIAINTKKGIDKTYMEENYQLHFLTIEEIQSKIELYTQNPQWWSNHKFLNKMKNTLRERKINQLIAP